MEFSVECLLSVQEVLDPIPSTTKELKRIKNNSLGGSLKIMKYLESEILVNNHVTHLLFASGWPLCCYLSAECVLYMHPVVFHGVVTIHRLGQSPSHVDQVVQRHGCYAPLGNWDSCTK